jgi:hypothetical protein
VADVPSGLSLTPPQEIGGKNMGKDKRILSSERKFQMSVIVTDRPQT